ncbi:MAG TPA: hypothetical protein P5092_10315 [Ruminococcus sp.]|nr:hypothetical protein [Ruminococcus sp.]
MDKFSKLRSEYPTFTYRSYSITESDDSVKIDFVFSIDGLAQFTPSWEFPKPESISVKNDPVFGRLAFSMGMAEAVSYWKAACSPKFIVECGTLDEVQIKWWKKLWYLGLGEFFYVNGITTDQDSLVEVVVNGTEPAGAEQEMPPLSGCLVPIGGGKDSALTLETLVQAGKECKCYAINKRASISATVSTAGLPDSALITAKRNFDRSLVDLNSKGFLNGHTPFSSVVAFSAEITAYLNRLAYIVLSNEDSANESTVVGQDVNHQYSKSFEFEKDFRFYEENYLRTGIYYFSFLRPLAEFQIAKMFVHHRKYLPVFRSCNLGSKVSPDIWCGNCPKCLFVALILSPFLSESELTEVFGKDMLNDESFTDYFTELIGRSEHKPFECVGSIDEVNLAVSLAIRRMKSENAPLPKLFGKYERDGLYSPETLDKRYSDCCSSYNTENLLPEEFRKILSEEMRNLL